MRCLPERVEFLKFFSFIKGKQISLSVVGNMTDWIIQKILFINITQLLISVFTSIN